MHELNPDVYEWSSTTKTNAILADIYDVLMMINSNIVAGFSRKPAKKPKPYPRPRQSDDENTQHFGSGALPVDKLHEWIENKRAEYARSSTGDHNRNTGT